MCRRSAVGDRLAGRRSATVTTWTRYSPPLSSRSQVLCSRTNVVLFAWCANQEFRVALVLFSSILLDGAQVQPFILLVFGRIMSFPHWAVLQRSALASLMVSPLVPSTTLLLLVYYCSSSFIAAMRPTSQTHSYHVSVTYKTHSLVATNLPLSNSTHKLLPSSSCI